MMKKKIDEVTPHEVLYGDKGELLYDVLYNKSSIYTVEQYLHDNFFGKKRIAQYNTFENISNNSRKSKFPIRIFYKDKTGKQYTDNYHFDKSTDVDKFVRWCNEVGIRHGIS